MRMSSENISFFLFHSENSSVARVPKVLLYLNFNFKGCVSTDSFFQRNYFAQNVHVYISVHLTRPKRYSLYLSALSELLTLENQQFHSLATVHYTHTSTNPRPRIISHFHSRFSLYILFTSSNTLRCSEKKLSVSYRRLPAANARR